VSRLNGHEWGDVTYIGCNKRFSAHSETVPMDTLNNTPLARGRNNFATAVTRPCERTTKGARHLIGTARCLNPAEGVNAKCVNPTEGVN
ncbi:hypothetical protein BaRGS_00017658, partial [Batillaria attramentaria]